MPKKLIALIIFILLITCVSLVLDYNCASTKFTASAQFLVLVLTLLVLIIYAWDTRRIANATEQKWEEEIKPKLMYEMVMDTNTVGHVLFRLINSTDYFIEAKVNCNFKIYGQPVKLSNDYDGTDVWVVYPHQISQGHFLIESILTKIGKNYNQMIREKTDDNTNEQLTSDLEIQFTSENGRKRIYPERRHYYRFDIGNWIPEITKKV